VTSPARAAGRPSRAGRVVIGTLGLDQHEVGAIAISQLLVRHGYEVIYLGRFNTPERLAAVARQEDADIVGVSVHSWEFVAYADELLARCRDLGVGLMFGGSVLTETDRSGLLARGADAVFGPYASEDDMLQQIDAIVDRIRSARADATEPAGPAANLAGFTTGGPGPLAGRVVIVTGAARGLGRAHTVELCRQGAAVVASDVDEAALGEATAAIDLPGSVHPVACDITDPDAPRILLDAALRRYGQLHGLVSNVGLLRSGPILRLPDEDLQLLLDVHVTAAFRLLRVIGGYWRAEAKAGRAIGAAAVLTTSAAGLYGFRAEAAYSAAKAAVAMLARVAADEMARYQVTVNAIAPVARTRLTSWLGDSPGGPDRDPWAAEHVAPVVAWLIGPAAREVTGRVIEAGNGQLSVPGGWQPGTPHTLPPLMSPAQAQALLPRVLGAGAPAPLLAADAALSGESGPPRPEPDPVLPAPERDPLPRPEPDPHQAS
jgi:methylmalonyl-CoA mutase cobalamin-binding domain/chain